MPAFESLPLTNLQRELLKMIRDKCLHGSKMLFFDKFDMYRFQSAFHII